MALASSSAGRKAGRTEEFPGRPPRIFRSPDFPLCSPANHLRRSTMPSPAKSTTATIIPALMYADCPAAIEWLCNTFGFEKHAVYPGEGGTIAHAELTFGNGMIMLGSAKEDGYGKLVSTPARLGNANTQAPYLIVTDADAL